MLTSLYQALMTQLSGLDFPVYLADCIPEGAVFPYAAADVRAPLSSAADGTVTLTIWCRSDASNAERLSHTDALLSALPARGVRLALDGGAALLRQKGPSICIKAEDALALRTVWTLSVIPSA